MLAIAALIFVLWLFGFIGNVGGGLIHLLLIVCGILFILDHVNNKGKL